MTLTEVKQAIWAKCRECIVTLQVAADKALVTLPITEIHEAEKLLKYLTKEKKKKVKAEISPELIKRYRDAKYAYEAAQFPNWIADDHFIEPEFPDTSTANGLQSMIVDHATWMGCHANRINTMGRQVDGKWITGSTKKGTADVALIIGGRSVHLEIKVGNDKPRPEQLKQQIQVRKAGGVYEFIHNAKEYFEVFDRYYCKVLTIFDAT